MAKRKKKKKAKALTKKQLNVLYECWKDAENNKDRLALIEERLPKVPSLAALSIMRKMAKTETKWLKMATRKKNQQEREKLDKQTEREQKKHKKEKKKVEREKKREEKKKFEKAKTTMDKIREAFKKIHMETLEEEVEPDFFFCGTFQHFVNNISCIYRVCSEEDGFPLGSQCEKCSKLNKYIPIVEEIIKNAGKETKRYKASKGSRKAKKQTKESARRKAAS